MQFTIIVKLVSLFQDRQPIVHNAELDSAQAYVQKLIIEKKGS